MVLARGRFEKGTHQLIFSKIAIKFRKGCHVFETEICRSRNSSISKEIPKRNEWFPCH